MNYLIIGSSDSGKSEYAENLLVSIAKDATKLYIATMVPYGEEGAKRIQKHRAMREGKGFVTIEKARQLGELKEQIVKYSQTACILECLSNLVANEMYSGLYDVVSTNGADRDERKDANLSADIDGFAREKTHNEVGESKTEESDNKIIGSVVIQVKELMAVAENLVIVTNDYDIEDSFDEETIRYCNLIKKTNDILKDLVDEVHIVSNGEWTIYENS